MDELDQFEDISMRRVLLEVKFKDANTIKSFEATGESFYDALNECFKLLDKYNLFNDPYEILFILKA